MSEPQHLKDHYRDARIFTHRVLVAVVAIIGLLGVLLGRFYNLQVVNHQDYVTQSDRNRVHVQPIPPNRGLIYDRNGILLANNRPSYTLSLIKERVDDLEQTLRIIEGLVDVSADNLSGFHKRMKQRRRPFEAVPLKYRLTEEDIARIAVNEYRLPGVEVEAQLVRDYPFGKLLAHAVGYVGRINDRELKGFDEEQDRRYSGTYTTGKIGLEKFYEDKLLGEVGYQYVETNARGQVLRVLERIDPKPGADLTLHLDVALQKVAMEALGEKRGSVVAIEVATGGVLSMASTPSYDPNLFVTGISYKDYNALNQSLDLPLFNRAIQGQYPPGSTLKPMLGLGALNADVIDARYKVRDPGYYQLEGDDRLYRDWKRKGHATHVNLHKAVVQSCDTYFYDLAFRMGIDRIHDFGRNFGLGQRTGIDIPSERRGIWPSREWKKRSRRAPWFPGDSLNVGLGQGFVLATPLQLATMSATLASRGHFRRPQFVRQVSSQPLAASDTEGSLELETLNALVETSVAQAPENVAAGFVEVSDQHWNSIYKAMEDVVHSPRGTAQSIRRGLKYRMAGKTGTAQVVGIAQGEEYDSAALAERQRDHALFVAFAPVDNPQIAVAVIVDNGEKSSTSAKIARKVIDYYLDDQAAKAEVSSIVGVFP